MPQEVLAALPPLAPGVRAYDRALRERDDEFILRDTGICLIQLYKRDAPEDKRLATLMIHPGDKTPAAELANMLVQQCRDYGYFAEVER